MTVRLSSPATTPRHRRSEPRVDEAAHAPCVRPGPRRELPLPALSPRGIPHQDGGERVVFQRNVERKVIKQRDCLGFSDVQEVSGRSYVLRGTVLAGHNFQPHLPL
jgi:hypothetical protein